jgi:hypothetical protein
MFASAYSNAKKSNRKLQLVTSWYSEQNWDGTPETSRRYFELSHFPKIRVLNTNFTKIFERGIYILFKLSWKFGEKKTLNVCVDTDKSLKTLSSWYPLVIHGYMQEKKTFESNHSELKDFFKLDTELETKTTNFLNHLRKSTGRLLAIHIRRGDNFKNGKPEYVLKSSYFEKCLDIFNYQPNQVVIFSDEIEWCKRHFEGRGFNFIDESCPAISLVLLSKCDDFILSMSTFSWWGAWLGNTPGKRVLFPQIYEPKSHWNKLAEDHWISIDADFE